MNGGFELLNIGPLELVFILAMMILFLGPKDMARLARQTGAWIRRIRRSSLWNDIMKVDREIRDLPVQLAREAGFEEQMEEIRRSTQIPPLGIDAAKPADAPETAGATEVSAVPQQAPGEVRSPGSRLRPPMRRGTPPPPRTETPAEDAPTQQAEPVVETEPQPKQATE